MSETPNNDAPQPKRLGLLAQFAGPDEMIDAARQATDAGYQRVEAFAPFPVIGIDEALKAKGTLLPWIVFCMGFSGCFIALAMQLYTNGLEGTWWLSGYEFLISGKPSASIPAFIPVTFEVIVLLSAFGAFFGMLILNKLPTLSNPLFSSESFQSATTDGFFLFVESDDPKYAEAETEAYLTSIGATGVEPIDEVTEGHAVPGFIYLVGTAAATVALLPPLYVWATSSTTSTVPRISFFKDMESQAYLKAQQQNNLFADGRAMRVRVPGTVGRGMLQDDRRYYEGIESEASVAQASLDSPFRLVSDDAPDAAPEEPAEPNWTAEFPERLTLDKAFMDRGEQRFNIHCAACHGLAGNGDGLVSQRALALEQGTWVQPLSIHVEAVTSQPVGKLFNTISHGVRKMPGYKELITVEDRWAIILYMKALQRSQAASAEDVPEDQLKALSNLN